MMRKYKFKFLMKSPTHSESARCGELHGFSAHLDLDAFLKSALFLLAAALLTLGSFFSQAYGVSSAQYQEQEDFSYVRYELEAVQVAEVLLEIEVSPEKMEEILGSTSLSEDQKLTLIFHETKGLWVFDTSKHRQPVVLIACKWYQVDCTFRPGWGSQNDPLRGGVEKPVEYTNREVTSATDDSEEVLKYVKKVITSARDDIEEIIKTQPNLKYMEKLREYQRKHNKIFREIFWEIEKDRRKKEQKKSSKKDQDH